MCIASNLNARVPLIYSENYHAGSKVEQGKMQLKHRF